MMESLRKTAAVICAVLFAAAGTTSLFLFNFDQRAFTAETYKQAFAREDFYDRLPGLMADGLAINDANENQFPTVMQGMGRDAWEAFFRALLPPEILRAMGDDLLDSIFAYINMETDTAHLNLAPLKARLSSEAGAQAALTMFQGYPPCDLIQVGQMTVGLASGGQIELCNPPAELYPLLLPVIQSQLQFAASLIPDRVIVSAAPPQNDPRRRLEIARAFMRASPLLPAMLLLGILIFGVRSLEDWLKGWGIPMAVTGGIAFMLAWLGAPLFNAILHRILASQIPDFLPILLLDYTNGLAAAMTQTLLRPVLWQALALAFLGGGMTGAAYLMRRRS
jgi:hypothetical protein